MRKSENIIFLVDPSAFSISYNFFLAEQIQSSSNFQVIHFTRAYRKNETVFTGQKFHFFFYFFAEKLKNVCPAFLFQGIKFIEHFLSSLMLLGYVIVYRPAVIHYQWVMLPQVDLFFIRLNQLFCTVVHTVHNDVAYHGKATSKLMIWGYERVVKKFDLLFLHSEKSQNYWSGEKNIPISKTCVIRHGPIPLPYSKSLQMPKKKQILFFGFVRNYKGVHDLIAAFLNCLKDGLNGWQLVVAGKILESREELLCFKNDPILSKNLVFHDEFLSDQQLADLVDESSIIVLPYRSVTASAALISVTGAKCTVLASDLS
ncbi:MAG: glycosyltransferase, partial [Pseudobdellovibrionaceae bacterium]